MFKKQCLTNIRMTFFYPLKFKWKGRNCEKCLFILRRKLSAFENVLVSTDKNYL